MSEPTLTVVSGPDKDKTFRLKPGQATLGRHADALYRLSDVRVSRHHAEVALDGDTVTVIDQGSVGGTLLNGVRLDAPTALRPGDVVQIGETMLRLGGGTGETVTVQPGGGVGNLRPAAEYDEKDTAVLAELCGRTLGKWKIGDPLGVGSTSMVFRATHTEDGSARALKVMQPAYGANEDEVDRFVRAMKATMPFAHENIVRTFAAGKTGPYCWAALELVEGESLTAVIKRIGTAGMLDWKYAFRVGLHVGRALAYAHQHGVIHRDVTPANILIAGTTKTAKLGDLTLAKALEGAHAKQITRPGEIVGDVNYMSPERAGGATAVDARSDLFSLGATVYALLAGKPPFAGTNLIDTMLKIRSAEPLRPATFQMGIPDSFEFAVLKLLAKRPDDRYQSAEAWVKELERVGKFNGAPLN